MKVTRTGLGQYFAKDALPSVEKIAEALTFHSFEIDGIEGDQLDVKVLPNRAADCLSHIGIAQELSAILNIPLGYNPLAEAAPSFATTEEVHVEIIDTEKCSRYMAALVKQVKVGPSPEWLKQFVESLGQRSINNVVDSMNMVMFYLGQPLHAFDAAKLTKKDGAYSLKVRAAKEGEKITALTGEEFSLREGMLLIVDGHSDTPLAIAGIKGGIVAAVTEGTTEIIIESANFDGTSVRRTAQALKLFTDASLRFQNRPSPELCAYGLSHALQAIETNAGGSLVGVAEYYPQKPIIVPVSVSLADISARLGSAFSAAQTEDVFKRLGLPVKIDSETFTVTPPFQRTDLIIPEDLIEEVGRIVGYEHISSKQLPEGVVPDQARYRGMERMKDQMVEQGFTEISTQSFAKKGDIALANPLDKAKPYLRTSLEANLTEALIQAKHYAPLVLPPNQKPKLFEVGTVFPKEGEFIELRMTEAAWEGVPTHDNLTVAKLEDYGKDYTPKKYSMGMYKPFSVYPFVLRDIAFWVPSGIDTMELRTLIAKEGSPLVLRVDAFDTFEKGGRISYAFRIVFESPEKTLTDDEVNGVMEKITNALTTAGYEVR